MQTYQNQLASVQPQQPAPNANNMASFMATLMSLNQQELQCLHADSELMRQFTETQLLLETRLQRVQLANKLHLFQQQQQQHIYQSHHHQQAPQSYLQSYYQQQLQQQQQLHQQQQANMNQLALDLRTQQLHQWPAQLGGLINLATAINHNNSQSQQQQAAGTISSSSSSNSNASSAALSPVSNQTSQQQRRCLNPKKLKLSEYQRSQQAADQSGERLLARAHSAESPASSSSPSSELESSATITSQLLPTIQIQQQQQRQPQPKKYKGEFDEPAPEEVEQRMGSLARPDTYHHCRQGRCACVLGSEFPGKAVESVLEMIDVWRRLPTEERIRTKWDLSDLPKDIPLADIKKFEELRREASAGRADFGGASKRKPLGIRGTRQFLLILYCLWGHPGRQDQMQKEGYCPHCFAKIKKANEQSTLVRVVNHFNMKHRRGANPRLSPHRDSPAPASKLPTLKLAPKTEESAEEQATGLLKRLEGSSAANGGVCSPAPARKSAKRSAKEMLTDVECLSSPNANAPQDQAQRVKLEAT